MTTERKYSVLFLLQVVGLLLTTGCDKKCQQPATEKFKSVTGQQWRLVETTDQDPNFKNLSKSTFLVFEFTVDYKGSVKVVQNNTSFDTPVKTFIYNIDKDGGLIRVKYTDTSQPAADPTNPQTQANPTSNAVVQYQYELGRELELTDSKGNFYRFVPFTGIVAPDDTCTF